jgi:hypothetical protein
MAMLNNQRVIINFLDMWPPRWDRMQSRCHGLRWNRQRRRVLWMAGASMDPHFLSFLVLNHFYSFCLSCLDMFRCFCHVQYFWKEGQWFLIHTHTWYTVYSYVFVHKRGHRMKKRWKTDCGMSPDPTLKDLQDVFDVQTTYLAQWLFVSLVCWVMLFPRSPFTRP